MLPFDGTLLGAPGPENSEKTRFLKSKLLDSSFVSLLTHAPLPSVLLPTSQENLTQGEVCSSPGRLLVLTHSSPDKELNVDCSADAGGKGKERKGLDWGLSVRPGTGRVKSQQEDR